MSKKLSTQEKARRLWVRALRSGKYGWGKKELRPKDNQYCCLGVLCEVAIEQGIISDYYHGDGTLENYPEVVSWVGLATHDGEFRKGSSLPSITELTTINDGSNRNPFNRIAKLIESKPEGMFESEEQA